DYEREHEKKRRAGATDSTKDLPPLELLLDMVRRSGGMILNALTGVGKERSIQDSKSDVATPAKTDLELAVSRADMPVAGRISAHPSGDMPDMDLPEDIHEFLQLIKGHVPDEDRVAEDVVKRFDEGSKGDQLYEDAGKQTGMDVLQKSVREHPELLGTVEELTESLDLVKPFGQLAKHLEPRTGGELRLEQLKTVTEVTTNQELLKTFEEVTKNPEVLKIVA